ncbi:MAG: response regulator, partial [Stenotrophomonas sp.]
GSVREFAQSVCERLQQRGAQASLHREDAVGLSDPAAVMLDLILDEGVPTWDGPQVVACREGGMQPLQVQGHWQVGLHRLDAIVVALAAASGQPLPAHAGGHLPTPRRFGLHVLVAEDNPINQAILRGQLEQLGCHAVVASDGNEALGYWQQRPFALVLTDLNMPGLDGYGLARALRARGVGVPIHGATANADPAERQRCFEAGMQGVLVKPITLEALQRLLAQVAASAQVHPSSEQARDEIDGPLRVPDKMQTLFLQTMQADLDSLQRAIDDGAPERVAQVLHRIRGALVIVDASALVACGERIEQRIADGERLPTLATALAGFRQRLQRLLEPLAQAGSSSPRTPTSP